MAPIRQTGLMGNVSFGIGNFFRAFDLCGENLLPESYCWPEKGLREESALVPLACWNRRALAYFMIYSTLIVNEYWSTFSRR
jgi:hypothetical protein